MLHERIAALTHAFEAHYGTRPSYVVRAPGRVNLLGEHTDYNGLPVLPMAIDRCVLIAGRPRSDTTMSISNRRGDFEPREFALAADITPYPGGDWGNYAKAAAQGLFQHFLLERQGPPLWQGADLLVDGDVPAGAGLSSSSALVVAHALAVLCANNVEVPFTTLAELLPIAERYVGTLSGGMDQAVSLLAQEGALLRIDFFPVRTRPIVMPSGYSVVVCHSLVSAEKSGAAKHAYNTRVIECRLACRALESALGATLPRPLHRMGDLASLFPGRPLSQFMDPLTKRVPDRPLSLAALAAAIGSSAAQLRQECDVPRDIGDRFSPVRRARHVLSEADRVNRGEGMLLAGDIVGFAQAMDESHASCRDDYEISCPELEELVDQAKSAGASAARLTGAGFGGCTVNLVPDVLVGNFLQRIDRGFYRDRLALDELPSDYRFVFRPQAGAGVVRIDSNGAELRRTRADT